MENSLVALSGQLVAAVEKAGQSVVTVHGRPRVASSGIAWKPGVIVTAEHTLRREEDLRITLPDGSNIPAELVGRDPGTDLAVLKAETGNLPLFELSDASETLRPGTLTLTVGRSSETGVVAAMGVLSGVPGPWNTWRGGRIDRFIRLDIGLYPGSSGGAAVSVTGKLIGMATGGLSRTAPIAVPPETITRVVEALLDKGHIAHGYLGVGLQPVPLPVHLKTQFNLASKSGLIVLSVEPDSPAGQAGVVIGDVFLSLDGKTVSDPSDVQAALGFENVGKRVKADLMRGGVLTTIEITIGERPRRRA